jgi:hypothetical protein
MAKLPNQKPDDDRADRQTQSGQQSEAANERWEDKMSRNREPSDSNESLPEGSDEPRQDRSKPQGTQTQEKGESAATGNRSGVPPSNVRREDDKA